MISIFVNLYLHKAIITGKLYIGKIIPQNNDANIGDENGGGIVIGTVTIIHNYSSD